MQDNLVSVIEDNKDHKELIASQLAQAQIQLTDGQQLNHQTLTVQQLQHLQVQQVLDNVVRMESAVENNQNQTNEQVCALVSLLFGVEGHIQFTCRTTNLNMI